MPYTPQSSGTHLHFEGSHDTSAHVDRLAHTTYAADFGKHLNCMEVIVDPEFVPFYSHPGDAGLDLRAAEDVTLLPTVEGILGFGAGMFMAEHEVKKIRTGLKIALPKGHVGFIVPRSSLGSKGITVSNSPGTIDAGYRGEIQIAMINHGRKMFKINKGDRIAQLIVMPFTTVNVVPVTEFTEETERGEGGFGSTGVN